MSLRQENGFVTRLQAGFYTVQTDDGELVCRIRGRLKQKNKTETLVAVGDRVTVSRLPDGSGVIETVKKREREFFRTAPSARGEFKQVLLANPDQIVMVFSCAEPAPSLRMLDRFLVIAEKQDITALIVANKVDLVGMRKAKRTFSIYSDLGYPLVFTSAKRKRGIGNLQKHLNGKVSVFLGPSGVGKSSLLNCVQPNLGLKVGFVKESSGKGRHTTVVRELYPLDGGGYVADMPGLRTLSLWDIEPEELDGYFPELRGLVSECRFNDCSHIEEPGCAVKLAVEEGIVHPDRYDSYVRLRLGDESD
jgi:ribosome biogenesis GTPase